jgi:hypothetical protein
MLMASLLSWKIYQYFFELRTPSASMLTCRRRAADMTQTLMQTMPLTLNKKEARLGAFPGGNGITTIFLEKADILPLFSIFRNCFFIDRDFFYECSC